VVDVEGCDQSLSAVTAIFELVPSTLPGTMGWSGAMRSRAWMPVFSSMETMRWVSSAPGAAL